MPTLSTYKIFNNTLCIYRFIWTHTQISFLSTISNVHCILCSGTKACEMKLLVGLKENENENEEELRESVGNIGNYHLGVQWNLSRIYLFLVALKIFAVNLF